MPAPITTSIMLDAADGYAIVQLDAPSKAPTTTINTSSTNNTSSTMKGLWSFGTFCAVVSVGVLATPVMAPLTCCVLLADYTAQCRKKATQQRIIALLQDDSVAATQELRHICAHDGLGDNALRALVWPRLMGLPTPTTTTTTTTTTLPEEAQDAAAAAGAQPWSSSSLRDATPAATHDQDAPASPAAGAALPITLQWSATEAAAYCTAAALPHRDSVVVGNDVARSLIYVQAGPAKEQLCLALAHMLNAAVKGNVRGAYYTQGLHDIAGVLLMTCGERAGSQVLSKLVAVHLRDITMPDCSAALEVLALLPVLVTAADPNLGAHLHSAQLPTHYGAAWLLTWLSRRVGGMDACARVFDLCIALHPLMPLYVAAVGMCSHRRRLMGLGSMELFKELLDMELTGMRTVEQLVQEALALYAAVPPASLLASAPPLHLAATPLATQGDDGLWQVAHHPLPPPPLWQEEEELQQQEEADEQQQQEEEEEEEEELQQQHEEDELQQQQQEEEEEQQQEEEEEEGAALVQPKRRGLMRLLTPGKRMAVAAAGAAIAVAGLLLLRKRH